MKRFFRKIKIAKIVFFSIFCLFASNAGAAEVTSSAGLEDDRSDLEVTSNVKDAEVYINSTYQGKTPIVLTDLLPLKYRLEVKKDGYSPEEMTVQLQKGMMHSYYVPLKESRGTITFSGVMPGSFIYIDDELYKSQPMEVKSGEHDVKVRKFGYEDQNFSVNVTDKSTVHLSVSMRESRFALSDFSVSRKSINPQVQNNLSVCEFRFSVTAPADGVFTISDANGRIVYIEDIPTFQTWDHSLRWNGMSTNGEILPNGTYMARISAGGQSLSAQIEINYALIYSTNDFTTGGTGIGVAATATSVPERTLFFYGSVMPTFDFGKKNISEVPVSLSIGYAPLSWLEFSAFGSIYIMNKSSSMLISGAVKAVKKIQSSGGTINLAALLHYGGTANFSPKISTVGYNRGAGLNFGGSIGYEAAKFYVGLTSEYALGVTNGDISAGDSVWRNVLTAKYQVLPKLSVNGWVSLHSAFNMYDTNTGGTSGRNNFARAMDVGVSTAAILGNSSFMINAGLNAVIIFKEYYSLGLNVGVAYWL